MRESRPKNLWQLKKHPTTQRLPTKSEDRAVTFFYLGTSHVTPFLNPTGLNGPSGAVWSHMTASPTAFFLSVSRAPRSNQLRPARSSASAASPQPTACVIRLMFAVGQAVLRCVAWAWERRGEGRPCCPPFCSILMQPSICVLPYWRVP